jgi:glycosyltransferase involved in cell wall biosynthesis
MVIHNGVDITWLENCSHEKNEIRKAYGLGPDDFVIGNVGRLVPPKDQESLIRGMAMVTKSLESAKLIIVGTGPLRTTLENLVRKLDLEKNVIFAGSLQREAVYQLLHAIDLFVMYSLWEGFCNALVEAMAARKPVVASDIETFREIMGESSCLVPPQNPTALATAILDIANMPVEERQVMGEALHQHAATDFFLKSTAEAYQHVYERMLQQRV